jgi:hypothetical protein
VARDWLAPALDKDHCVALWDNVLIQVWHFAATAAAVTELERIARSFILQRGGRICSVAVIERTSPPPKDDVRVLLAKFYRELAPQMSEQIVIADGGGFRGALVRAVGVTLSTFAPRALPFRFVGSVNEATALVAPHLSARAGGEKELQRVLREVREDSGKVATPG